MTGISRLFAWAPPLSVGETHRIRPLEGSQVWPGSLGVDDPREPIGGAKDVPHLFRVRGTLR